MNRTTTMTPHEAGADQLGPRTSAVGLFRRQAAITPGALAVDDGRSKLSFADLAYRSGALADRLVAEGAVPGEALGVCMPRCTDAVVALLAVMEAGCAYVPLDPAYPVGRLQAMCATAGVRTVIGDRATDPQLADKVLDSRGTLWLPDGDRGTGTRPSPDLGSTAYVIFTSGSTGTPKGVRVTHGNLAALLEWVSRNLGPDELAMTATTTSFSFDPSLLEVLGPLVTGGSVRVIPDVFALGDAEGVTLIASTPSVVGEMLAARRLPSSLRCVMVGGEVLSPALAGELLRVPGLRRLLNAYGPTEATVMATFYEVSPPVESPVPIGLPLAGTGVVVVDESLGELPDGDVGELVITGPQVAAGYIGDASLTARRFVELTGPDGAAVRGYRTGDLGRRRPDGLLEYRGRVDRQVKVRGYRVEPGEVEAVLTSLREVSQAVVCPEGNVADAVLVAYVVPRAGALDVKALRRQLKSLLPAYLVPSKFVVLDALPTTQQGKVDVHALPSWAPQRAAARGDGPGSGAVRRGAGACTEAHGAPELSEAGEIVAGLVREVLGLEGDIGPADDFLDDLGGSSLALVQLLARVETAFSCRLAVGEALQDTTVGGLADLARRAVAGKTDLRLPRPHAGEVGPSVVPLFWIHPYVGSVLRCRRLARHLAREDSVIGIQVLDMKSETGESNGVSLANLAEAALEQIRAVKPRGPYLVGGHSAGGLIAFEVARRLQEAGDEVLEVVLVDSPALKSRLDYIWAEAVLNWPEVRSAPFRKRIELVRGIVKSRLSLHRRTSASPLALVVEQATRRVNVAVKQYRSVPYAGKVTLLWTSQGRQMARKRPALGWSDLVVDPVESRKVSGGHITMFDPPYVAELGQQIDRTIQDASLRAGLPS
jgi:amino acid adenylation domain-containing protein